MMLYPGSMLGNTRPAGRLRSIVCCCYSATAATAPDLQSLRLRWSSFLLLFILILIISRKSRFIVLCSGQVC